MYAMKVNWVGQTFALATVNDSGSRKSRIRRSKEERKAMVVSFIKRYQTLNDGNFPSLNLTHKEVGGSFYTVREIVREIIQENKVLGPANFSSEEKKHHVADGYLPQSFSSDRCVFLSVSELDVPENQENLSRVLLLGGNDYSTNPQDINTAQCSSEHKADEMSVYPKQNTSLKSSLKNSAHAIKENHMDKACLGNGAQTDYVVEELGEQSFISESSERDRHKGLVGACSAKLTLPTKELVVETFPLRPALKEVDGISDTSTDSRNINETLKNSGTMHNEISNSIHDLEIFSSPDSLSEMVTMKGVDGFENSALDSGSVFQNLEVSDKIIHHEVTDLKKEMSDIIDLSLIKEATPPHEQGLADGIASQSGLISKTMEHTRAVDQLETSNKPDGTACIENTCSATRSKNAGGERTGCFANKNYIRGENKDTSGAFPTLDRIYLESWESKSASNQETNPLLTFFKAFVDAFVKFWSG